MTARTMQFTTPLKMEPTGTTRWGRLQYRLTEPLVFEDAWLGIYICIPKGRVTDMISAPWGLRWLAKWLLRECEKEVVLHDELRSSGKCSPFMADAIFRAALAMNERQAAWKRALVYYGARLQAVFFPARIEGVDKY